MTKDVHELARSLLSHPNIAADFWKQGYESGLGVYFSSLVSSFPHSMRPLAELCVDLCAAGSSSADYVLACLDSMGVYAEPMETVSATHVEMLMKGSSDRWKLLVHR